MIDPHKIQNIQEIPRTRGIHEIQEIQTTRRFPEIYEIQRTRRNNEMNGKYRKYRGYM